MTQQYKRTSATLYRQDYEWLLAENDDLVRSIEHDLSEGVDPGELSRFIANTLGDHRVGSIRRCHNAIKHIVSVQGR